MAKQKTNTVSDKTVAEAMVMAKATQKPGQDKEQTKLIAQGIQKGIAEYKKREKEKSRQRDKERKQEIKQKAQQQSVASDEPEVAAQKTCYLPWVLLLLSWAGFAGYLFFI